MTDIEVPWDTSKGPVLGTTLALGGNPTLAQGDRLTITTYKPQPWWRRLLRLEPVKQGTYVYEVTTVTPDGVGCTQKEGR